MVLHTSHEVRDGRKRRDAQRAAPPAPATKREASSPGSTLAQRKLIEDFQSAGAALTAELRADPSALRAFMKRIAPKAPPRKR